MNWEERIENYVKETGFPKSLFIGEDDRVVGTWIMGNNYQARKDYYGCLAPDAPVLTADLRWIPMSKVKAGDMLVGFDETIINLNKRAVYPTKVIDVGPVTLPGIKIELEDGRNFICSNSHLWLVNGNSKPKNRTTWRRADELKNGDLIRAVCNQWDNVDNSNDAGWLGGIIDGEGNLDSGAGLRINITQNPGLVQSKIIDILTLLKVPFVSKERHRKTGKVQCETRTNNFSASLMLLGITRPIRMLNGWINSKLPIKNGVIKIKCITPTNSDHEFIGMNTESKTFVAYGLASHNSYPAGYLKRIKALFPDKLNVLHLFSGKVDTVIFPGKTVDINPANNPDYVDDAQSLLNVPLATFDLVLADPPYSVEDCDHYQTTMIKRNKVMKALGRGLVSGTYVVWLDQVLPMYRKDEFSLEAVIGMCKSTNHRFRMITIFRKL